MNCWTQALLLLSVIPTLMRKCLTYVMLGNVLLSQACLVELTLIICLTIGKLSRFKSVVLALLYVLRSNPANDLLLTLRARDGVGHVGCETAGVPCKLLASMIRIRGGCHRAVHLLSRWVTLSQETEWILLLR